MRCVYSISLISSQQRNNSIYHGADRWINPVPRSKMLLLCMFGPVPQGNCSARSPICCFVGPASRRVIGASNALLNWCVHKIGALSLETADTRYSLWTLSGCHCSWVSLLLAFVSFWLQSIGAQLPAVLIYFCCCIQPLQAHAGIEHQIVPQILSHTLNLKCFYISLV
jgi:hypothetical protein